MSQRVMVSAETVEVTAPVKESPKEVKRRETLAKLSPELAAYAEQLKGKKKPPEAPFVRDGKAQVQVWLKDKSPGTLEALKKLGFEIVVEPTTANLLIGQLPAENLLKLAELDSVRYIAVQTLN